MLDPTYLETAVAVAKALFFFGSTGFGLLLTIRAKGFIDLHKSMQALTAVMTRLKELKDAGHLENITEAGLEAVELVKKFRRRVKLSPIIEHKIKEQVTLVMGHLFGSKPKRLKK